MNRFNRVLTFSLLLLGVLSVSSSLKADVSSGIVGWWKFDGNATDSSGAGFNSAANGSPTYTAGKISQAVDLNGTSQYISGTGPNIANSPFTISVWIFADQANGRNFYSLGSTGATRQAIHLRLLSATSMRFGLYSDDLNATNLTSVTGRWTHIAVTLDASNVQRIYQDGALKTSRTAGGKYAGNTSQFIGRDGWTSASYFDGRIDDVRVYSRALSAAEILNVYDAANGVDAVAPSSPTGLTAANISQTQLDLSWTASTDNVGVTGYKIERCTGVNCYMAPSNFVEIGTTVGTTFNSTALTVSTEYDYRISAYDAAGNFSSFTVVRAFTYPALRELEWVKFDVFTAPATWKSVS